jgi:S-adenosyl-L-methionine hydrolase (adenosine-forming)
MARFITLLTDFGTKDASVSIAKSVILLHNPDALIFDISHDASFNVLTEAAYLLSSSYKSFPIGSCHIVYVDIHYGAKPVLVLCEKDGHYFLAPDNGILTMALGDDIMQVWKCFELTQYNTFREWQESCAKIIHQLGDIDIVELGLIPYSFIAKSNIDWPMPVVANNWVDCKVLHIDSYGNLIVNINQRQFDTLRNNRNFRIDLMKSGKISTIIQHVYQVANSDVFARFNSSSFLEIGIKGDSAAQLLGFVAFSGKQLFYSSIKIFFE